MTRPVPHLVLRTEFQQGVVTVHIDGSLEYGAADRLVTTVTEELDRTRGGGRRPRQLCLDLAELTFTDSMGLAALLMARRVADARGVALRLTRRPESLDCLLRLTCTFDYLTASTTPNEAAAPAPGGGER